MESKKEPVGSLIDKHTQESMKEPNINANLAIAERIKEDRKEAKEAVGKLAQILKAGRYKR